MTATTEETTAPSSSSSSSLLAELEARVEALDVETAKVTLQKEGVAIIKGVLPEHLVRTCVREAEESKVAAFYSCSRHNPFLVPDDHPEALANPLVQHYSCASSPHPNPPPVPHNPADVG